MNEPAVHEPASQATAPAVEPEPGAALQEAVRSDTARQFVTGWIVAIIGCVLVALWIRRAPLVAEVFRPTTIAMAATLFYAVMFAPLIALGGLFGLATRTRTFAPGRRLAAWVPGALALGLAGMLATVALAWLNGGLLREPVTAPEAGLVAVGIGLTLVQVSGEEVVFRGWLQPLLGRLAGPWAGLAIASALFAAMHLLGGRMPALALANVFLAGVWFGLLALRSGGIAAPIAAHFGWNALEDIGFGLIPNPGAGPFGALHDIRIAGPAVWGGGEDGLNASIGTTIVLIALILPLLALPRRRRPLP